MRKLEDGKAPVEVTVMTVGVLKVILDSYLIEGFREEFEKIAADE